MLGAGRLTAQAALRAGAGLVTWGVPAGEYKAAAAACRPEIMLLPLKDTAAGTFHAGALNDVRSFLERRRVTCLAVGPGLAVNLQTAKFVRGILSTVSKPMVLDADGLNVLAVGAWPHLAGPTALTPHAGEAARLLKTTAARVQKDRPAALRALVDRGVFCALKGRNTLVGGAGRTFFENSTGNPGMATGGAGDVLCGLIAGLTGQMQGAEVHDNLWKALLAGVFLHGLAGDLAAERSTRVGLAAGDIIDFFPEAFRKTLGRGI